MLRRIGNFFRLDLALSTRDSVLLYSLISPLILALIVRLVVPSVQQNTFTMAVHDRVPQAVVEYLETFGSVEHFVDAEAVRVRVGGYDDVPGLVFDDSRYLLILEGNEDARAAEGFVALVRDATARAGGDRIAATPIAVTDLGSQPAPILEYGAVMIVCLSLFVGGVLVGFNVVDEKESGMIAAMAVSPLRVVEYIAARGILAAVIAYVAGFGSAYIILGAAVPAGLLALAILAALFVALPFGFIIGGLADNQMTAFALIKLLMALFLSLPFVSIFVPGHLQWLFYVFPNYWMFQAVRSVLVQTVVDTGVGAGSVGLEWSMPLSVATGLAMTMLLYPRLKRGLRLR